MERAWRRTNRLSRRITLAALLLTCASACQPDDDAPATEARSAQSSESQSIESSSHITPPADLDPASAATVQAALDAQLSEVETSVQKLPGLIASIRRDMRRFLNEAHVTAGQRSGVGPARDSAHVASLVSAGTLVQIPDSSRWWVLRELDQSLPYVTPDTRAVLEEIGRRFHTRLEARGLPPFRFDMTSVLRTGAQQDELRRRNRNASGTTSSHEFGTTFDIAYLNFAAPQVIEDPSAGRLDARLRAYATMRLDTLGRRYAPHIEGELGAVLQEMQREGRLMTLRERSQPVFHTTVVRD